MNFYIETYGCQMNVADSELITSILISAGHQLVQNMDQAELILFNTCSVRAHAEERVLGRISNEQHRKKTNPNIKIGLLGCMAQRIGEKLLESNIGIDIVAGVDQYNMLPAMITSDGDFPVLLDFDSKQVYHDLMPVHQSNTCGFVTIMRGCNNFCSYCIVPHVRGRERSRPWKEVYADVKRAGEQGLKDITLLGQNVNSYHDGDIDFPKLLKYLNSIDEISRLRFITSHPKDLSDSLIEVMSSSDKICEHIHLPMQSGNNRILHEMNRNYTIEHYLSRVNKLKHAIPGIAVTTDIIAGFPSETDAEFEDTLSVMQELSFDYAFCFKYSPREGTDAAGMINQVPEEIRLSRLQQMIELQRKITYTKFRSQIGKCVEVYVESFSKKSDSFVSGKTRDYKIAVLSGTESDIGTLKKATVIDATAGTLICE
ncbi:MAG: tRNA (N6-isopentenyl adenosine(37)-C2)-methylthiotransferase MiaB [Candidatus Cloacimonetes bacterium HGW-Cloacimonetes-3]|nr:MAG: tRNA (N6-isopentenyl adenosine(37)-C2)-methylthiotransferase MiaB [Candidatus Cloacimonetes bacterium HGW-Cloacimonetes-3]